MQSFISQWQELVALKTPIDVLSQNYIACNLAGILTRLLTEWKSVVTKLIVKGKIMRYIEQMFDSFFHLIQICFVKTLQEYSTIKFGWHLINFGNIRDHHIKWCQSMWQLFFHKMLIDLVQHLDWY